MATRNVVEATVQCGPGGWYVEWYLDDVDKPQHACWYGTRHGCLARAKGPVPKLHPVIDNDGPSYVRNAHVTVGGELE